MKKSEFLTLLKNEWALLHRGGWSEANDEERLDVLLQRIEDYGMLPPTRDVIEKYYDDYEKANYSIHMKSNTWESDDES